MPGRKRSDKEAQRIVGRAMLRIAFDHELDGPYIAADHIRAWAKEHDWPEEVAARSTMADYFRGKAFPSREFVNLFTEALNLSEEEQQRLSLVFTFPVPLAA